ncbi:MULTISPECIES: rhomboid family intramembrane serine protease [unclassified Hyphomonas]|jgi:membrane associated rhomboid family serine protease|uniref:rhomboid family intramembrane serine protease n=1 Tax=unclassified Hyphomonas TaxID=2630699 RepID=UPI000C50E80C|nr:MULTISPECIES: rhomboid family intramembrane serine protease [unclassified Hyphomonas]MAL47508.1 rhomboid family intramembrane serine protease [Hyphomonas sp.]MBG68104.1 rhomboid family intramembrane serine protease [Hyphomonas sp.]MBO6584171.1 rhomboid family intramembrane serine protease [Hyphomonas sp.]QSR21170.1 rhomboid family intramembrane serine protease [Hyphomonas sp. KY3]HAO34675.1 rhomboid family intramembrane serine protease [Hyphomonas sp.]|tara:strand:+ start:6303 stop:6908 length:606 start_codon:yes stop_codon:yes gene_type:complete
MMEYPVTISLIAANVLVSLIGLSNRAFFEDNNFWIAPIREGRQWWRFVTSAFLHVNSTHLLINMFVLWQFGGVLERELGATTFLIIYFGSLFAGNAWEYIDKRDQPDYRAVGASGATSGIVLAFSVLAPFAVLYLLFILPMWAIVAAVLFISVSFFLSQRPNTMIAHGAHLGGALAGAALTFLLVPGAWSALLAQIAERLG